MNGVKDIESDEPPEIDTSVAHSARIYDYVLGGKDNFEADRVAAEAAITRNPNMAAGMQANRAVMRRMTAHLAAEVGLGSSSTSAQGYLPARTCTRSPSGSRPSPAWSTSTTTRSS